MILTFCLRSQERFFLEFYETGFQMLLVPQNISGGYFACSVKGVGIIPPVNPERNTGREKDFLDIFFLFYFSLFQLKEEKSSKLLVLMVYWRKER